MILFVAGCSTDAPTKFVDIPIELRTPNSQLQSNFDSCLHYTQQLIKATISDKEFSEYFSLDKTATGFEYDSVVRHLADTLFQLPRTYQIFYVFVFKGDTLSSFRADFDSTAKLIDYRNFHLLAFRQFIDKKMTVTRAEATIIARKNGMKGRNLELIFYCSADRFYWECKNDCVGCLYLDIDAKTGNVVERGKIIYQY